MVNLGIIYITDIGKQFLYQKKNMLDNISNLIDHW